MNMMTANFSEKAFIHPGWSVTPIHRVAVAHDTNEDAGNFAFLNPFSDDWKTRLLPVFQNSPYLCRLATVDPDRLIRIFSVSPDEALMVRLEQLRQAQETEAELMTHLRRLKAEISLLAALCDLLGIWSLDEVTASLSGLASNATDAALSFLVKEQVAAGFIAPHVGFDPFVDTGYFVIAMGKLGAAELNYSSDIDVVVFFDPVASRLLDKDRTQRNFIRLTKSLVKILNERTGDGYVFRTDVRLRPDPGATPIAISTPAAMHYYESQGQNWERAAFIKANFLAGDGKAAMDFLDGLAPFIWRRHLDFAAISDIHSIKRQIHAVRGHSDITVAGHNVKLGRGGIREIEFFVQTQQLITGGRDTELRGRGTLEMLQSLATKGWISHAASDDLERAYIFLRQTEHRLQMINDEQTHTLPKTDEGLHQVAQMMAFEDQGKFADVFKSHLLRVSERYGELFQASPGLHATEGSLVFTGHDDDPETLETLFNLGYQQPSQASQLIRNWHHGRYKATRSAVARERLTECVPIILEGCAASGTADQTLHLFDSFLARLPVGLQFFSLISNNPNLINLLTDILGNAPELAQKLIARIHFVDALLDPAFFSDLPSSEEITTRIIDAIADAEGYENQLNQVRIVGQEQLVLIGTRLLSGTITADVAARAYGRLADCIITVLLDLVKQEFAVKHGAVPGGDITVVAMGKLGAEEMTASSDLDLIVIYDAPDNVRESDGQKPLPTSLYYIRLTQRLISALSVPTKVGRLYEVDMRLRPSGNKGPVAVSLSGFQRYHNEDAWIWEHMALTRARIVAGDDALAQKVRATIVQTLSIERDPIVVAQEVAAMRGRIAETKKASEPLDLKMAAGGIVDIEFIAQYLQLAHGKRYAELFFGQTTDVLKRAAGMQLLDHSDSETLCAAMELYTAVSQSARIALPSGKSLNDAPQGWKNRIAEQCGLPEFEVLKIELSEMQKNARNIFERLLRVHEELPGQNGSEKEFSRSN